MSRATFQKIIPALYKTKLAFLQGWGEPFTHPDFFHFLKHAKKAGCRVGTSTNGMLLDREKITQLVDSELDLIAFSLAGLRETNDKFRCGTRFDKIIETCRLLKKIKAQKKTNLPAVHIAFLLLRSGLEELNQLPEQLKDIGIEQIVVSTLDFIPSQDLEKETIRPRDESEYGELKKQLDKLVDDAARYDLELHYHFAHPDRREPVCTENVLKAAFIAVDGSVAPCVFRKLPINESINITEGPDTEYTPLTFGNIDTEPFDAIWRKAEYNKFRAAFIDNCPLERCCHCPKLYMT